MSIRVKSSVFASFVHKTFIFHKLDALKVNGLKVSILQLSLQAIQTLFLIWKGC